MGEGERESVSEKAKISAEIAEIKMQIALEWSGEKRYLTSTPLKLIISDLPAFVSSLREGEKK